MHAPGHAADRSIGAAPARTALAAPCAAIGAAILLLTALGIAFASPARASDIDLDTTLQWQLGSPDRHAAAIDVAAAWAITPGAADTVIAIIDTGVLLDHPELSGRWLPGYDFVSADPGNPGNTAETGWLKAADGNGRDEDPTDPGDGISEDALATFADAGMDCQTSAHSWHGTAIASIVAANVEDMNGMHGIDRRARLLPVRAVGRCGGRRSDLLDAIRWSAGLPVDGVPDNPYPAHIINLSLGMHDACSAADQRAIDDARAAGAIVVAALGNGGRDADLSPMSPSQCRGVIGVVAVESDGTLASYSNRGFDADIAAPGGTHRQVDPTLASTLLSVASLYPESASAGSIMVAANTGSDASVVQPGYRMTSGTSIAVPHVTGVLGLMRSANPDLGPRELEALLLANTRAFPVAPGGPGGPDDAPQACRADLCGTGLLDAGLAVRAARDYQPGTPLPLAALDAVDPGPVVETGATGLSLLLLLAFQRIRRIQRVATLTVATASSSVTAGRQIITSDAKDLLPGFGLPCSRVLATIFSVTHRAPALPLPHRPGKRHP